MKRGPSIAFLFIGGPHQIFHAAPIAAELVLGARDATVTMMCTDAHEEALIRDVLALYDIGHVQIIRLDLKPAGRAVVKTIPWRSATKLPLLFTARKLLNGFDAIVVPERTSARLRWVGVTHPKLIHVRHGAGDRAPKSERRLKAFDLVVVPGAKDARRAIDSGLVPPERIAVVGYVKFDLMRLMRHGRAPLFDNGRPTVLYNPHFDTALSSWGQARDIIERFRTQDDYNLVVAPHIRLFENASADERRAWESLAEPGKIIVDLGSDRSIDMTYTFGSDLYLGDVSSQLYEFLVEPRPCVFLNSHGVAWQHDRKYAGWHLGEVVTSSDTVLPAIARAFAEPHARDEPQRLALADAVGGSFEGAAARGAEAVLSYLDREAA